MQDVLSGRCPARRPQISLAIQPRSPHLSYGNDILCSKVLYGRWDFCKVNIVRERERETWEDLRSPEIGQSELDNLSWGCVVPWNQWEIVRQSPQIHKWPLPNDLSGDRVPACQSPLKCPIPRNWARSAGKETLWYELRVQKLAYYNHNL